MSVSMRGERGRLHFAQNKTGFMFADPEREATEYKTCHDPSRANSQRKEGKNKIIFFRHDVQE